MCMQKNCNLAAAKAPKNQVEIASLLWRLQRLSIDMLAVAKALKHPWDWSPIVEDVAG